MNQNANHKGNQEDAENDGSRDPQRAKNPKPTPRNVMGQLESNEHDGKETAETNTTTTCTSLRVTHFLSTLFDNPYVIKLLHSG